MSCTTQSGSFSVPRLSIHSIFPRRFPQMMSKSPSPSISVKTGELYCLLSVSSAGNFSGYQSVPWSARFSKAYISPERLPRRISSRPSWFQSPLGRKEWRSLPTRFSILKKFLLDNQSWFRVIIPRDFRFSNFSFFSAASGSISPQRWKNSPALTAAWFVRSPVCPGPATFPSTGSSSVAVFSCVEVSASFVSSVTSAESTISSEKTSILISGSKI